MNSRNKNKPALLSALQYRLSILLVVFLAPLYALSQTSGDDLLLEAKKDFEKSQLDAASKKAAEALELLDGPGKKADAHLILGLVYQIDNKDDDARLQFAQAFGLNPDLQLNREQYSPATIQLFNQAKQEGVTRIQRGDDLYQLLKYEEALVQYDAGINLLIRTSPDKNQILIVKACLTTAEIHQTLQNNDLAIKDFQRALNLNPELELNPGDFAAATIQLFQQAKGGGNLVVTKAKGLIAQKNNASAIELLQNNRELYFTQDTKKDAEALLAQASYLSQKEPQAIQAIQALLEIDPAYEISNDIKNTPFGEFFQLQRIKLSGTPAKVLIVQGPENPIHNLTIQGFQKQMEGFAGEIKTAEIRNLKKEVKNFKPDIIFAPGFEALQGANKADAKAPTIFTNIRSAKAAEIKSPTTGGIFLEVALEEQFSVLRAVLPHAKKVGVLYSKEDSGTLIDEATRVAANYNFEIVAQAIGDSSEIEEGMKRIKQMDALALLFDPSTGSMEAWNEVIRASSRRGVPVFTYGLQGWAEKGALFSLAYDFRSIGTQAAELTKKVFVLKPNTLPRVYPSFSTLAINLAVAKKLNIEINPNLITKDTIVFR